MMSALLGTIHEPPQLGKQATVDALASELRRVKESSATRGYLRWVIETLERFPPLVVDETLTELAVDSRVRPRFRQRLRAMTDPLDRL